MEASRTTVIFPIVSTEGEMASEASVVQRVDTVARLERARKAALVRAEANRRRADALEREVLSLREQLQGARASQAVSRAQIEQLSANLGDAMARKTHYMQALIDLVRAVGPANVIDLDGRGRLESANGDPTIDPGPVWLDDH